jgi:hypothetical protein
MVGFPQMGAGILKSRSLEAGDLWPVCPDASSAHPSLKMNLLDVIAFIPNPGIGVASSLEPVPASEMAEKTVLHFLLAQFDGHSGGYAVMAAAAATMVVTVTVTGPSRGRSHGKKTTRKQHACCERRKQGGLAEGWQQVI